MSWIFDHLGLIVFLAIAFSIWRKAKSFLREVTDQSERRARSRPANYDPAEDDRVRKIQEEIRRKIAERRGGVQPVREMPAPAASVDAPPVLRRGAHLPTDPFGGPMRKVFAEVERRLQTPTPTVPTAELVRSDAAQLERQQQLAEEMRVLEESRMLSARRAAQVAASVKTEAESERGALTLSRKTLLRELHDTQSLRRAFVLREVLSAPVGLR